MRANELRIGNWVYLIYNPLNNTFKIGVANNLYTRFNQISSQSGIKEMCIIYAFNVISDSYTDRNTYHESVLHKMFEEKRTHGEWFDLYLNDITKIKNYFKKLNVDVYENHLDYFSELELI
jgi:hypothetical protein